ncbi:MAG: aryl-sulfate sulfotransferase [Planctomycetota bacterium]
MRVRLMVVAAALFVLATMGPPALAGDSFWHGADVSDSGPTGLIPYEEHWELHKYLATIIPGFAGNGGMVRMPAGEQIVDGDRGVRIHKPAKCWKGFTLLNSFSPATIILKDGTKKTGNVVLIDMYGKIINVWNFPGPGFVSAAKLLPGGHVVGSAGRNGFIQLDWNGNTVHTWPTVRVHHDHERQGNPCGYFAPYQKPMTLGGNILTLESERPPKDETLHICRRNPITDDLIRELDWQGNVLFEWRSRHYIDFMGLDEAAREAIHLGHNGGGPPPGDDHNNYTNEDWSHGNAVAWVGPNKWWSQHYDGRFHPQNIIADFRSLNVTIIIARYDDKYGKWKAGDIVWKLGPDYSSLYDDGKVGQIIGQHMAHMVPMYMPGEGNILIFDNGGGAGYGSLIAGLTMPDGYETDYGPLPHVGACPPAGTKLGFWPNKFRKYSRVVEINPITKQLEWEYKQPFPTKDKNGDGKLRGDERLFYSDIMSGCQRLMNGNTLITEADTGRIFEVTCKGEVVWEYAANYLPFTPPPGMFGIFVAGVYRAYRVPEWWIPQKYIWEAYHCNK